MNKNFIAATRNYSTLTEQVRAPYLRRSFHLDRAPLRAEISICGLGFYELYVNGTDVTKGYMAPYISNPDDLCYYDTYDITDKLAVGENVIGILLGDGFLNCKHGWEVQNAEFRGAPRVALELNCTLEGGEELELIADESFLTHPSPVLFNDIRFGITYDARLELDGWNLPGFDTEGWTPAIRVEAPRGVLRLCTASPVRVLREVKPVSITREEGGYRYDFGVNSAGVCRISVKGEAGQRIALRHGEQLVEGKFYNTNLCFWNGTPHPEAHTDRFICSGGEDTFVPKFRYNGFRYVLVEGITEEQATPELLTYLVLSGDFRVIGGFNCSDERINTLYRMVDNANRSNLLYFPTDCPHREKNGWTGDASLSVDQMLLMYDLEPSLREWLENIKRAQRLDGALPGIVPTSGWGFAWGNGPTWDSVLFNLPYTLYKLRGCTEVVRECASAMVRYLDYILTRRDGRGLVAIGLGDWVPVNKPSDRYDAPLSLTDSVMVMDMARKAAEMLTAIGYTHQAEFAEGIYRDMRDTIRRELVDPDSMLVAGDCQSSQCIALYYGVFDECERERAFAHLVRQIHAKDDSFDCGFIGMHCLFHVLSDFGESELAFKLITRDRFPSYTLLIEEGLTALPEHFLETKPFPESLNHHFLGDISRWFTTRLAGLKVIDHRTVEIKPCPVSGVDFAEAYYDLPLGRVTVRWDRNPDGTVAVKHTAPEGVRVNK